MYQYILVETHCVFFEVGNCIIKYDLVELCAS
jgi:hypothetical protein